MASDKDDYLSPNSYVRVVGERDDGSKIYQAGERSNKYKAGQIVTQTYADQVRKSIHYRNRVFGVMSNAEQEIERKGETELPTDYIEARDLISEFNDLTDELEQAQEANDAERIEEIEQDIRDKRSGLGS